MSSFPFGGMEMYEIMEELQKGGHTTGHSTRRNTTRKIQLFNMFIEKGWDPVFVRIQFRNLDDTMLREWPPNIFIEHWAKLYIRYYRLRPTIRTTLRSLGLTHNKTNELLPICRSLLGSSYTNIQIIDVAIEYAMGHYDPIRWRYFTTEARKHTSLHQIRSICSISLEPQLQTLLNAIPKDKESTELYFHTTSWASCLSILNGISHGIGRECLDFGLYPGFYLSQDICVALDWGSKLNKTMKNQIGILVFSLPRRFPDTLKRKHLVGREWKDVTHASRRCKKQPLELEQLLGYDFVYGNMVGNVGDIEHGIRPEPHTPAKLQLVSKSAKGDVYLQDHIVKCIYFDPL
jgi:hypothetical protein